MATQSSNYYQQQLANMGEMPNFRQEIAKAYEAPVLKPITQEAARLEAQYLPAMFEPFAQMGTSASDMSPAAKLALMGGSLGRLTSQMNANRNIGNYFGGQISDLANTMTTSWQQRQQQIKDLFNMAFQQEEARRQAEAARRITPAIDYSKLFPQQQVNVPTVTKLTPQQQQQAGALGGLVQSGLGALQGIAPLLTGQSILSGNTAKTALDALFGLIKR